MKTYIGVKIVQAEPCTLGDYNRRRGWQIPADEDPARAGYYLQYPDGYLSWSPAEIFRAAYRLISADEAGLVNKAKPASTYYTRLLAESEQLEDRKEKLSQFIASPAFGGIVHTQQNLLRQQLGAMHSYAIILGLRIAATPELDRSVPVEGEVKIIGGDKSETAIPFNGE